MSKIWLLKFSAFWRNFQKNQGGFLTHPVCCNITFIGTHNGTIIAKSVQKCKICVMFTMDKYTVPQKTCDYIFYNNFNNRCPITIIFGKVSSKSMRHRKIVSFPTSHLRLVETQLFCCRFFITERC